MRRFGLFQYADLCYALDLVQIFRIIQNAQLHRLPRLPDGVSAVLVDDERLIPLLSLSPLGVDSSLESDANGSYQVVIETESGTIALPARLNGRIVTETKGVYKQQGGREAWILGEFTYQNIGYKVLDIDFIAVEITQNFWRKRNGARTVRRHS